ncbi:hypothetical protein CY34DRAFT_753487 [Suillus luteus UH-Slu-Lm8-n1]|uniref:Uncharacterized protein n=1 Tax=Suillus luteus UH-Slu-Lm8-n1 TaxID=930992 RepID=A0A0C9ZTX1_9AGAM|nr:hypothetical protein CY34DRAFT_753487 [Suillus luteus UH-Slu-Lm8-n1]
MQVNIAACEASFYLCIWFIAGPSHSSTISSAPGCASSWTLQCFSKFNAFHSTRINWTNSQPLQAVLSQRTYHLVSFFSRTVFEINNTHRRNTSKNGLPTRLIIECSRLARLEVCLFLADRSWKARPSYANTA